MTLPYNLQKLPPEALDVLRFMGKTSFANAEDMQSGTGLSQRSIGKIIRRLVTIDYIHVAASGAYELTTDGRIAVNQLAEYDGVPKPEAKPKEVSPVARRLTVVMPRQIIAGRPAELFIGVNPPAQMAQTKLPGAAQVELKISTVGGTLSGQNVTLEVPPDKAAQPGRISVTPAQSGRPIRVRVDAFQAFEFDNLEPLGGMYFDIPVLADNTAADAAKRAVGMDVMLKPPR
jgi:hypothetical protein